MSLQNPRVLGEPESFFQVFPESRLGEILGEKHLTVLEKDAYQFHARRNQGYLGALVANFLNRKRALNVNGSYVPAYAFSEAIGMDFAQLLKMRTQTQQLVEERSFSGQTDLYLPLKDVHLCVWNGANASLTQLATFYHDTHNPWVKEDIARGMQGFVLAIADNLRKKKGIPIELEELVNFGNLGFLDALEKFRPDEGVKFETYASKRILGAMLDGLREIDSESRLTRSRINEVKKAAEEFYNVHGRMPSFEEAFDMVKSETVGAERPIFSSCEMPTYYDRRVYTNAVRGLNFEIRFSDNTNEHGEVRDPSDILVARSSSEPISRIQSRELLAQLELDLMAIPRRYRKMMRDLILGNETMASASAREGVSESRASQIFEDYSKPKFFRRTRAHLALGSIKHFI